MKVANLLLIALMLFASACSVSAFPWKKAGVIAGTFKGRAWKKIYTGWPAPVKPVAFALQKVACSGPYALCAYAQCKIIYKGTTENDPTIAECGCYGYPSEKNASLAENGGTLSDILDKRVKVVSQGVCDKGKGKGECYTDVNVAPVCKFQNYNPAISGKRPNSKVGKPKMFHGIFDIISTFNPNTWPGSETLSPKICRKGQVANCYTAGCLLKPSFNGYNTTCYCPVYSYDVAQPDGAFVIANNGTCAGSNGNEVGSIVYNGGGIIP